MEGRAGPQGSGWGRGWKKAMKVGKTGCLLEALVSTSCLLEGEVNILAGREEAWRSSRGPATKNVDRNDASSWGKKL